MSRFQNNANKPKAEWTHLEDVTKGDQRYSFYISAKGAIKLTRHTPQGEAMVMCVMGAELANIVTVSEELPRINQAFLDAQPTIQENKVKDKALKALAKQESKVLDRGAETVKAATEGLARAMEQFVKLQEQVSKRNAG